jgi:hypothetical protein
MTDRSSQTTLGEGYDNFPPVTALADAWLIGEG